MSETIAYLTGYLEADGWVTCYKTWSGYFMNLGLEGTERVIVEELQRTFGGRITIRKARGPVSTKDLYRWNLYGKQASTAIKQMEPYFRQTYKAERFALGYVFWTEPDMRDRVLEMLRARTETERERGASLPCDSPSYVEIEPIEKSGNISSLHLESNND